MSVRSDAPLQGGSVAGPHHWLDGRVPWGCLDVGPTDRTGTSVRYRLRIYPPGITAPERRMLVMLRRWPFFGPVLALLAVVITDQSGSDAMAFTAGGCVLVGGLVWLRLVTRTSRRRTLTLNAMRYSFGGHAEVYGDLRLITRCVAVLAAADRSLATGTIDRVRHEAIWWRVYTDASEEPHSLER